MPKATTARSIPSNAADQSGTWSASSGALHERVSELQRVLLQAREGSSKSALEACQRLAHQVYVIAEREGFREVASAVWHVEDALMAIHAGDLAPSELTWRQIDAACRAAQAACDLPPSPAEEETVPEYGAFMLLSEDRELGREVLEISGRNKLRAIVVHAKVDALTEAATQRLDALVVAKCSRELAATTLQAIKSIESCRRLPTLVLGWDDSFEARIAAASVGATEFVTGPPDAESVVTAFSALSLAREAPRILVASDDQGPDSLDQTLTREGFVVHRTAAARSLLETLERVRPDALVLRGLIAGYPVTALGRILRAEPRWRDLPVLAVLPGPVSEAQLCQTHESGIDDVLGTPLKEMELSARLRVRVERTRSFQEQSNRDLLTGLLTRRAFLEAIRARLAEAKRNKKHLSLCLCDIDKFKQINDNYGHSVGDDVLAAFGQVMNSSFRIEDLRARWGGEEFIVAFFGEWAESAREILSRATSQFAKINFEGAAGQPFNVTVSAGIATFPVDGNSVDELVLIADQRLYEAKFAGRNRIRL